MLYGVAMLVAADLVFLPHVTTPWQSMIVIRIASAGAGALCTDDMLSRLVPEAVSFAGGIIAGAQSLSFIIMNPLIGRAVDRLHDYNVVALTLGIWVIPGSLIWIAWRPRPSDSFGLHV